MKKRKKNWIVTLCCLVAVLGLSLPAWSANIYVSFSPSGIADGSISSPTDLQTALDTAQTNDEADTIYLQEGTYDASTSGEDTYEYGSGTNDGMKVTLSGSWNAGYTTQKTTDAPSTTLDGGGTSRVMYIDAQATSFDFAIEYLNIENGYVAAGSSDHGVGIRAVQGGSTTLNLFLLHVGFQDNTAEIGASGAAGGGMFINSYFEARESRFKDNWAQTAGAIYISSTDVNVSPIIDNCVFDGNIAGNASNLNSISTLYFANSPIITNSTFKGNPTWEWSASAVNGATGTNLTVSNCIFSDFHTYYWGGAIHIWAYDATISNSLFVSNSAGVGGSGYGGAIAIYDPAGGSSTKSVTVTNCTFFNNQGDGVGGAIHNRWQTLTVTNSIFWNNNDVDIYRESGTATISYSDAEGGLAGTNFTDGGNNINSDPLFANTTGDPATWDFQLTAGSPAMDTGDNTVIGQIPATDLNGNTRLWDGDQDGQYIIDMGPYEFGAASTIYFRVTPTSDSDCYDYACDLQSALSASAYAGLLDKEIRLAQGTYTGNFGYFPAAGTNGNLSILGGWKSDFSSRIVDPANTILDGNDTGRPLTLNNMPNMTTGGLKVEGLTLTHGLTAIDQAGGGLLAVALPPGGIDIQHNIIQYNTAGRSGGGILATSYDTASQAGGMINIADNIIRTNSAGQNTGEANAVGGGVFVYCGGTVTMTNNLIYDNAVGSDTVDGTGGGLYLSAYAGDTYLTNNTIVTNVATTQAGGVYVTENPMAWDVMDVQVYNNIIGGSPDCTDCREAFMNDISATVPDAGSSLTVAYNNIEVVTMTGSVPPTAMNNITGDPLFVSELQGKEDYHLRKGSICIDTGTNAAPNMPFTDIEGETRPQDGDKDGTATANMGCYEKVSGEFSWTMFLPAITGGGN